MLVKWNEWGKDAFAKARKEKKPVLLAIGAVWCHWCHAMDELTYKNQEIANFINDKFTPIRVDTDKRPDINDRYNIGGWPSTLILANDGEPVTAATYVPPENMVSFLEDALVRLKKHKPKKKNPYSQQKSFFTQEYFYELVKSFYDPANKGFGLEPKFLHPELLEYLLSQDGTDAKKMVEQTLIAMAKSEVFDQHGGGFFRYATQRNWTFPHFEKLLEDNARMLAIYLTAYERWKNPVLLEVINKTIFFLFTILYDQPTGAFYASQDADEAFCALNWKERAKEEPPFIDETFYTSANAFAAGSLLLAARTESEYLPIALKTLEFLWKKLRGGVLHNLSDGQQLYLFKDVSCLLAAFVGAFHATNRLEWKSRAETVAKHLERFYDKKNGGFFDILASKDAVGRLKERKKQVNDNALASIALCNLFKMTKNEKYEKMARSSLDAVAPDAFAMGVYAGTFALANELLRKQPF